MTDVAQARALNDRELLARCYSHLTGLRLPAKDPLYTQLESKKPIQVCVDLLNSVRLKADGRLENDTPVSRAVLKQLNDFHRGWFEKRMLGATELSDALQATIDVTDFSQPAYYISRALFTDGMHYNSALRGSDNVMAIRDSSTATASGSPTGFKRPSRTYSYGFDGAGQRGPERINESVIAWSATPGNPDALEFAPLKLVQVGELVGFDLDPGMANVGGLWTKAVGGGGTINDTGLATPINPRAHFGGGALGSQSMLLLNFGHSFDYDTNGTTKLPRRWMSAALKSFLCREGPYLRNADVEPTKRLDPAAPPFRQSNSCLRCHATMDQAALTTRNLVIGETSTFINTFNRISALIGRFNVSAGKEPGQEFWPWKPVANFKYQAPEGKLYMRSATGALIDRNVSNLNELGIAMSDTDDYYACAAKRYVERFTGVNVSLFDPADADNEAVYAAQSEKERDMRARVLALGNELRMTGSLKKLIQRIMESDEYRQSDFGK